MENSVGFMTVFAVSGSVVLVALQAHKRLLSDFMKKVELELGTAPHGVGKVQQQKKKVRFADDVIEPSSNNKEYRKQRSRLNVMDRSSSSSCSSQLMVNPVELESRMPENRRALYRGILQSKMLGGNTTVSALV